MQCDGTRAKPSKEIEVGVEVRLRQGLDERTVVVSALSEQRRGAPEAQLLYTETAESIKQRATLSEQRKSQPHLMTNNTKPNKRDRRLIHRFKQIE